MCELVDGRLSRPTSRTPGHWEGPPCPNHMLDHLSWVVSRMAGASQPDWAPPAAQELAEHFEQSFLDRDPDGRLMESLSMVARAGGLGDEVPVVPQRQGLIRTKAGDVRIETRGA